MVLYICIPLFTNPTSSLGRIRQRNIFIKRKIDRQICRYIDRQTEKGRILCISSFIVIIYFNFWFLIQLISQNIYNKLKSACPKETSIRIFRKDWMIFAKTVFIFYNQLYIYIIFSRKAKKIQASKFLQNFLFQ